MTMLKEIGLILVGAGLFMVWAAVLSQAHAQDQPFNVYETPSACVYVSGYGSTATVAVMPLVWKNKAGC